MQILGRVFLSILAGMLLGGVTGFLNFFVLMMLDKQKIFEAAVYSLIEAFICAWIGCFIGAVIGIFDLGAVFGGFAGLAGMLFAIGFFVLVFGGDGNQHYIFRQNWRVLLLFLTLPTFLTGVLTALIKNNIYFDDLLK